VQAKLTVNLPSQSGREDWWPVKLKTVTAEIAESAEKKEKNSAVSAHSAVNETERWLAEPIFGKSNLIFTLAVADGLLRIPPDATGLSAGEMVEVMLVR
jgi:molybdopterin molybdotransferase